MSVLIKLNYKLPKELETNVKFKKCTVLNFQYRSKEKPNQSTKQQERENKRARDTPLARIPRARPFFLLRPFTPTTQATMTSTKIRLLYFKAQQRLKQICIVKRQP